MKNTDDAGGGTDFLEVDRQTLTDIDDLNAQADAWCAGHSSHRPCPGDTRLTVGEAFAQEQPQLLALPDNPFETDERIEVRVGKTPYARFDLNDYSVPHTRVRRTVTVLASLRHVRVLEGGAIIAIHPRTWGKGEQIEDPAPEGVNLKWTVISKINSFSRSQRLTMLGS